MQLKKRRSDQVPLKKKGAPGKLLECRKCAQSKEMCSGSFKNRRARKGCSESTWGMRAVAGYGWLVLKGAPGNHDESRTNAHFKEVCPGWFKKAHQATWSDDSRTRSHSRENVSWLFKKKARQAPGRKQKMGAISVVAFSRRAGSEFLTCGSEDQWSYTDTKEGAPKFGARYCVQSIPHLRKEKWADMIILLDGIEDKETRLKVGRAVMFLKTTEKIILFLFLEPCFCFCGVCICVLSAFLCSFCVASAFGCAQLWVCLPV